jgi:hypothetical protein
MIVNLNYTDMHPAPLYPKWFYTLAWMIALIGVSAIGYALITARRPPIHPALLLFFALACAFAWVEVFKVWKNTKPFNCVKCLTGWFALALAWYTHAPYCVLYLLAGLFVGAMWEAVKMRWL